MTRTRGAHERILAPFLAHDADILIGTQMLAKGLDLPAVTVVGVVSADIGLHLPDFRAGERVFQLVTQVAGRAGRGERPGRVIIQTYTPDHYAIDAAARYDYDGFAGAELENGGGSAIRRSARLVRLLFAHTNPRFAREEATRMHRARRGAPPRARERRRGARRAAPAYMRAGRAAAGDGRCCCAAATRRRWCATCRCRPGWASMSTR